MATIGRSAAQGNEITVSEEGTEDIEARIAELDEKIPKLATELSELRRERKGLIHRRDHIGGRQSAATPEKIQQARDLLEHPRPDGRKRTRAEVAAELGITPVTLRTWLDPETREARNKWKRTTYDKHKSSAPTQDDQVLGK